MMAIPAKKGIIKDLTLSNGTTVKAELTGDEHAHYWLGEDGIAYVATDNGFAAVSSEQIASRAMSRRAKVNSALSKRMRKVSMGERTHYTGKKKGIVILVQYTDVKFKTANNLSKYKKILNEPDYSEGNFRGSVSDYFKAQSSNVFELDFDVVGPYTLKKNQSYYGGNDSDGNDQRAEEMIVEAVQAADDEVNFKDYDWDGDGEVDQVFVLYAGKGEADSDYANTVWPHMYELKYTNQQQTLDGVRIDTYACSNEQDAYGNIEGIGCFCHEFSHCLGFPDLYDTLGGTNFGMGDWDLMCSGSYNGNTFCPAGYSSYEKWMAGWLEPIELSDEEMDITNLEPMSEGGDAYVIYNKAHTDEYLLIENRQKTGWDASLPGRGLMIMHVDFDKDIWEFNIPNSKVTSSSAYHKYYDYPINDHQRLTIYPADNTQSSRTETNDLFPYGSKDSLTNTSVPSASLYNNNTDGKKLLNKGILQIKQNSDRTMSFHFRPTATTQSQEVVNPEPQTGDLFYESFNQCNGKGGNDGNWTTSIASSQLNADNEGWEYSKGYGGYQCARFGTSSVSGIVTTPTITLGNGTATLTFKAASWNADGTALYLGVSGNATISPSQVEMKSFEWQDYTVTVNGTGTTQITFTPMKRFLLDEVRLVDVTNPTGISNVQLTAPEAPRYYDLQGRVVEHPTKGIYILNGKKTIIK